MPLPTRPTYTVFLTSADADPEGQPTEHTVVITWADQLRAETMQQRLGITSDMGAHLATLWAWCALTRTGLYSGQFPQFKNVDLYHLDQPDAPPGDAENGAEAAGVDPTAPPTP